MFAYYIISACVLLVVIKAYRLAMTAPSRRVEVNLCRLLSRCETMASENNCQDWRLEKVNVYWMCLI